MQFLFYYSKLRQCLDFLICSIMVLRVQRLYLEVYLFSQNKAIEKLIGCLPCNVSNTVQITPAQPGVIAELRTRSKSSAASYMAQKQAEKKRNLIFRVMMTNCLNQHTKMFIFPLNMTFHHNSNYQKCLASVEITIFLMTISQSASFMIHLSFILSKHICIIHLKKNNVS